MKKYLCFCFLVLIWSSLSAQEIKGNYTLLEGKNPPKANSLEKVKVIEVLSFTCSYCYFFQKNLPDFQKKYGKKLEITHIPIGYAGINPSKLYFIALENEKGKQTKKLIFQSFHDSGIRNINHPAVIARLAKVVGLEKEYEEKKNDPDILDKIKFAQFYTRGKNIQSTPTFIIEDSILVVGANLENLSNIIDSLLKK